jgi:feruloyl-CoA synthase
LTPALLPPTLRVSASPDGLILESTTPLPPPAPTVLDWLVDDERTFLAERVGDGWRGVSYTQARRAAAGIAAELLDRFDGRAGPVLILSDNSIDHALLLLGAMHIGAPVVPVSPAYSLLSTSFRRLRYIAELIEPRLVFAEDRGPHQKALDALGCAALDSADLRRACERAPAPRAALGPDTVAKVLFTSGSTGEPKGVLNTHRMLTSNQESLRATWPFLADEPPVVVDWLPWSHTFGGNHNFNLVLRNRGTLYIDRGRPRPGLVDVSLRNLAEVGPTLWFNVPLGFDQAVSELERDAGLARAVFRNLRLVFYAAAALGAGTRARLEAVAAAAGNPDVFFTSAWGSTETAPLATSAHYPTRTTGVLGVPVPGVRLKLARVPDDDEKLELRVQGPNVTPGYWRKGGGVDVAPLDGDGFLPTGDAGRLVDEAHPEAGVAFAGRISENFKLSSGTWVHVGALRLALVEACAPLVADAVIAGHDRESLGVLLILSPSLRLPEDEVRSRLLTALGAHNRAHPSGSERIGRALVLRRPLSLDDGETTDKGYTNQRRVLAQRAADVERLFAAVPGAEVLLVD